MARDLEDLYLEGSAPPHFVKLKVATRRVERSWSKAKLLNC